MKTVKKHIAGKPVSSNLKRSEKEEMKGEKGECVYIDLISQGERYAIINASLFPGNTGTYTGIANRAKSETYTGNTSMDTGMETDFSNRAKL
jgi:hypothetical protein